MRSKVCCDLVGYFAEQGISGNGHGILKYSKFKKLIGLENIQYIGITEDAAAGDSKVYWVTVKWSLCCVLPKKIRIYRHNCGNKTEKSGNSNLYEN